MGGESLYENALQSNNCQYIFGLYLSFHLFFTEALKSRLGLVLNWLNQYLWPIKD
jgi:hypothetical protein